MGQGLGQRGGRNVLGTTNILLLLHYLAFMFIAAPLVKR